jgi:anti-sigma factor ChrR (cupin superfamily)
MESVVRVGGPIVINDLLSTLSLAEIPWKPFREGIDIHRFYGDATGPSAALLRYAPGACLARHIHTGFEHIFVLRGHQIDDVGEHHAGTLLIHPPGTHHAIRSPEGCIVLAVWEKAVLMPNSEAL